LSRVSDLTELGTVGANVLARAVARAIFEAQPLSSGVPCWQDCHSGQLLKHQTRP
jgi:hypothetical protein